jgi:ATP synthase subunit 6
MLVLKIAAGEITLSTLNMYIISPLEHFQVYPILSLYFLNYDYSITNETLFLFFFIILITIYFLSLTKKNETSFYIIPNNRWQVINELLFVSILSIISENIKHKLGQKFFPLIFFIFIFIFGLNIIGLVPFSFALTGHLIVTMYISLSVFIGINIIGFQIHGLKMFSLFLPAGTCSPLYFLIVLIELISYCFRPISLFIRLFANVMAGLVLIKVILGFVYVLMGTGGLLFILHYIL